MTIDMDVVQLSRLQIAIEPILDADEARSDARPALHQIKP